MPLAGKSEPRPDASALPAESAGDALCEAAAPGSRSSPSSCPECGSGEAAFITASYPQVEDYEWVDSASLRISGTQPETPCA